MTTRQFDIKVEDDTAFIKFEDGEQAVDVVTTRENAASMGHSMLTTAKPEYLEDFEWGIKNEATLLAVLLATLIAVSGIGDPANSRDAAISAAVAIAGVYGFSIIKQWWRRRKKS